MLETHSCNHAAWSNLKWKLVVGSAGWSTGPGVCRMIMCHLRQGIKTWLLLNGSKSIFHIFMVLWSRFLNFFNACAVKKSGDFLLLMIEHEESFCQVKLDQLWSDFALFFSVFGPVFFTFFFFESICTST